MFPGDIEHVKRMTSLKYEVGDVRLCLMAELIQLALMTCLPRNGTDHSLRESYLFQTNFAELLLLTSLM